MTLAARRHAWHNRISPAARQMTGLYLVEVLLVISWTFLAGVTLSLLSGTILLLLPLGYFLAAIILAWLEHTGSRSRLNCPLQAFGLAEVTFAGGRPTQWQTLRRIIFTPPMILIPGLAFLPGPGEARTLLQWTSGTRIVPLDSALDPRTEAEVLLGRRKARFRVMWYMIPSFLVAVLVFLIPPAETGTDTGDGTTEVRGLPQHEASLLAGYLEMSAIYPDSIEFHVRLASLYYRNGMTGDMVEELEHIRRLDPDHPMLLLGEDIEVTFRDIRVLPDSLDGDGAEIVEEIQETATAPDTAAADSTVLEEQPPVDSISTPETPPVETIAGEDTAAVEPLVTPFPDSTVTPVADSIPEVPDILPDSSAIGTPQAPPDSMEVPEPVIVPQDSTEAGGAVETPVGGTPPTETGDSGTDQEDQG